MANTSPTAIYWGSDTQIPNSNNPYGTSGTPRLLYFAMSDRLYCIREGRSDSGWIWCGESNDGKSWSADTELTTVDNCRLGTSGPPAVIEYGDTVVMVREDRGDSGVLKYAVGKWVDNAIEWTDHNLVATDGSQLYTTQAPALAVFNDGDKNVVYCVHRGRNTDKDKLFLTTYDGQSWTSCVSILNPDGTQQEGGQPSLIAYQDKLYCIRETQNGDGWLWCSVFDRESGSWSAPTLVIHADGSCAGTSGQPSLIVYEGLLHCIREGRGDDSNLWVMSFDGKGWSDDNVLPNDRNRAGTSMGPGLAVVGTTLWCAHEAIHNQGHVWLMSGQAPSHLSAWMGKNWGILAQKTLSDLCLPGTHDSGAYSFTLDAANSAKPPSAIVQQLWDLTASIADSAGLHSAVEGFSQTQYPECTIKQQLLRGIRYLDLRFCKYGENKEWYLNHYCIGPKWVDVASQIKDFLTLPGNEKEIILLKVAFSGPHPDIEQGNIQVAIEKCLTGVITLGLARSKTLDQLVQEDTRVVLAYETPDSSPIDSSSYNDSYYKEDDILRHLKDNYDNPPQSVVNGCKLWEVQFVAGIPDHVYISGVIARMKVASFVTLAVGNAAFGTIAVAALGTVGVTLGPTSIMAAFFAFAAFQIAMQFLPQSLADVAASLQEDSLIGHYWEYVDAHQRDKPTINLVISDFFDDTPLVDFALRQNGIR